MRLLEKMCGKNRNEETSQPLSDHVDKELPSIGADVRMRVASFAQAVRHVGRQVPLRLRNACHSLSVDVPTAVPTIAPTVPLVNPLRAHTN